MRLIRRTHDFESKMDMTPLIDCVFLLIMFFILTTQITVSLEEVTLPFALEGEPQKPGDTNERMLILNVRRPPNATAEQAENRTGEIVFSGKILTSEELLRKLQEEVAYDAADPPAGRGRKPEMLNGAALSQLEILIRYDREVRSEYLRTIFEQCQKVGIYKLKLATTVPQEVAAAGSIP